MHPVTQHIDAVIDQMTQYDVEITPAAVEANVLARVTHADWTGDEAIHEALKPRVLSRLKQRGLIISNEATRVRKHWKDCTADEFEAQINVKDDGIARDSTRVTADRAVLRFLRAKSEEMGYDVFAGLFAPDVERIYAMHGITAP